ncbi:MAG: hypothetical protein AAFN77_08640 [Planctomycetota bacterium]
MEIHNHGHNPQIHINLNQPNREAGGAQEGSKVSNSQEIRPQQLAERLKGDAAVRERLLVEVKAKVHAGEYMTRAAAEEAAQRMVE